MHNRMAVFHLECSIHRRCSSGLSVASEQLGAMTNAEAIAEAEARFVALLADRAGSAMLCAQTPTNASRAGSLTCCFRFENGSTLCTLCRRQSTRRSQAGTVWPSSPGKRTTDAAWSDMSMSADQTCEVKVDGAWRTVSLDEARLLPRDATKRCSACHGQVSIQGTYGMQPRLTLSHRRSHVGCSSSLRHYQGVPTRHPEALE